MRSFLLSWGFMAMSLVGFSQQISLEPASSSDVPDHRNCYSHEKYVEMMGMPGFEAMRGRIESHAEQFARPEHANESNRSSVVVTIPVVFHIVYSNATQNISDAQILSQLEILNDDFRRLNSDADNTWSQAADTEIEFCLASQDPSGNPTDGILRIPTTVSSFGTTDNVKFTSSGGSDAWPRGDYLNFWVCNIGGGILGYAQFPGGAAATDGVVCGYQYVGNIGTATAPFNLGRTATHEVGHWLNLYHIWGDGNCNVDDQVTDTPNSDNPNYGCATGHVSCSTTDMVENYMDYSDDACMNLFTQGQKTRMQALLAPTGFRGSLANSPGCTPACTVGCGCTDVSACNYDPAAETDDNSCDYSCQGCTNSEACNYDPEATTDDGSCVLPTTGFPCDCASDIDFLATNLGGGNSTTLTYEGTSAGLESMTITVAYSQSAGSSWAGDLLIGLCDPEGTCVEIGGYNMSLGYTDAGNWPVSWNGSSAGSYSATVNLASYNLQGSGDWTFEFLNAYNSSAASGTWDGTMSFDGLCAGVPTGDIEGCTDVAACTYNAAATISDNSCVYAYDCDFCSGATDGTGTVVDGDADDDGVCNEDEIPGCQDSTACNYNANATDEAACTYAEDGFDCDGNPITCPEDINQNGTVEVGDLLLLLADFGCITDCSVADVNGDGSVSVADILLMLAAFGEDC